MEITNNSLPVTNETIIFEDGRPTNITVICGYFFISWVLAIIQTLSFLLFLPKGTNVNWGAGFGLGSLPANVLSLLSVVSIFGYWGMKKWGVYLYTIVTVATILYTVMKIQTFTSSLVFSLIISSLLSLYVIYVGFKYIGSMA